MKRIILVLFILSLACRAQIASPILGASGVTSGGPVWTLKNAKNGTGTATPTTLAATAFTNALTNPSIIVACMFDNQVTANTYSISDTAGNTYTDAGPGKVVYNSSAQQGECFVAPNIHTTASNVITLSVSAGTMAFPELQVSEWTCGGTCSIDGGLNVGFSSKPSAVNGGAGANVNTGTSLTPASNGDLLISSFCTASSSITAGTIPNAWTLVFTVNNNIGVEYFVQTTAAAISATAGDTVAGDNYNNITIALK